MSNIHNMEQGTEEWHKIRLGKVTASQIAPILVKPKKGNWGAGAMTYQDQLLVEKLTGKYDDFISFDMQWGIDNEPRAIAMYTILMEGVPTPVGFVDHPFIKGAGASPDSLIGNDGLLEIKCPSSKIQMKRWREDVAPKEYIPQMQWQLACTGREWCDFVSFDPRMPDGLDVFTKRVERDEDLIQEMESRVSEFVWDLDALAAKYLSTERGEAA